MWPPPNSFFSVALVAAYNILFRTCGENMKNGYIYIYGGNDACSAGTAFTALAFFFFLLQVSVYEMFNGVHCLLGVALLFVSWEYTMLWNFISPTGPGQ